MSPFLVPSLSGIAVAGLSLLFYSLFGRLYGSAFLASVILLQASVAVVQMALVPQAWLYVLGSATAVERDARYATAMRIELLAGLLGASAILLITGLSARWWQSGAPAAALGMYGSLWIAGSTSHHGYFRARGEWSKVAAWMMLAPAVRLALVVIVPLIGSPDVTGAPPLARLIAVYFLLPDLCRFLAIHLPQLLTKMARSPTATLRAGLRGIGHNWLYDLGSAVVENGDKILVGALLGPIMLVVYFFARRIGSALSIAIEPAYAELYRRLAKLPAGRRPAALRRIYVMFLAATVPAAVALIALVAAIGTVAGAALPDAIVANRSVLLALLAIECGVSVNRWSRYVAQRGWMSGALLIVRLGLRLLFGLAILSFSRSGMAAGASLAVGYAATWAIETLVVLALLRVTDAPAPVVPPAIEGLVDHAT